MTPTDLIIVGLVINATTSVLAIMVIAWLVIDYLRKR